MPDQNQMMELAKAIGGGAAQGAGMGAAVGGIPYGLPGALAGMKSGALGGAVSPLVRHMFPEKADAVDLLTQGVLGFPLMSPALVGGAAMMMGGKPATPEQLQQWDAQDALKAAR